MVRQSNTCAFVESWSSAYRSVRKLDTNPKIYPSRFYRVVRQYDRVRIGYTIREYYDEVGGFFILTSSQKPQRALIASLGQLHYQPGSSSPRKHRRRHSQQETAKWLCIAPVWHERDNMTIERRPLIVSIGLEDYSVTDFHPSRLSNLTVCWHLSSTPRSISKQVKRPTEIRDAVPRSSQRRTVGPRSIRIQASFYP